MATKAEGVCCCSVLPIFSGLFYSGGVCFDVIKDLLNYVWVSDASDDTHSSATQKAEGNIKPSAARSKTLLSR